MFESAVAAGARPVSGSAIWNGTAGDGGAALRGGATSGTAIIPPNAGTEPRDEALACPVSSGVAPPLGIRTVPPQRPLPSPPGSPSTWNAIRTIVCIVRASDQRPSISCASARSTTVATELGTPGRTEASGGAGLVIAASRSSFTVSASWTRRPVSAVNIVAPRAQMSVRGPTSFQRPRACSGGMNAGVPIAPPLVIVACRIESRRRAIPKSRSFTPPSLVRKMLSGLMSR